MYALIDSNNFFVSCERIFNPTLRQRPVVVLSNNDGCVISRSNEAKKLGIPMGAPAFEFDKIFKENNVSVFSSNYTLYGDISNRVFGILQNFSSDIELYSIDESFLKFNQLSYDKLASLGFKIRAEVLRQTLIPTCVGIAPSKVLAKAANYIAKKYEQLQGVYIIDTPEKRIKALKWLPIEEVWGIGRRSAKKLKSIGVTKAIHFTQLPDAYVKKHFSIIGLRIKKELEGESVLKLEEIKTKKSIATTRSFDTAYCDKAFIKERVSTFAAICAEKLRKQHSTCQWVTVFIRTNKHNENQEQYSRAINMNIPFATNSSIEIIRYALKGLDAIFKTGCYYKKAGVVVSGIVPENQKQFHLFEEEPVKHQQIMHTIDVLNHKYGKKKILVAAQSLTHTHKMRQEHLSPNYTTNWKEILEIK